MTNLRLISWNIHGGRGVSGRRNLDATCQQIHLFNPHIVCLQEVHRHLPWGAWQNQPAKVARYLGMNSWYMGCLQFAGLGEGILVASSLTCNSITKLVLPSVGEPRGLLTVQLRLDNTLNLTVLCTHWGLAPTERLAQSDVVCRKINATTGPTVLCGDLNERYDLAPVANISRTTRLTDAFHDRAKPTFPADKPSQRIDYCFTSPDIAVRSTRLLGSDVESDHLALAIDLDIGEAMS